MIMLISHVESQRWPFNNTQLTKKCTLSVRTKKTTTTKKPTTISSTHHPLAWGNSLSVVEFLPGFLSHIIFNIFFPRNFQRWCLYCIYIIILDIKLFNILPSSTWCRGKYLHFMKNRIKWRETHFASLVPDAKYRYQNPPSAAYMKRKCFPGISITTSLSWNSSFVRKEHKRTFFLRPKIESTFYYFFSSTVGVMRYA